MLAGGNYKAIPYLRANYLSILKASSLHPQEDLFTDLLDIDESVKVRRVGTFCQAYFSAAQ